jgi:predicted Zn-dependent protease
MKVRSPFFAACCFAATALSLLLTGCNSAESRAQDALADYQQASAVGDARAARIALLKLVAAEDGNPDYWAELGKLQVQLGAYNDAYYAFTRSHELDKGNAEVLSTLTQLALLSGNLDLAEDHAQTLELLQPGHPAIKLTYGYVALRRGNLDEAERRADQLLVEFPRESGANLLKARVLLTRGQNEDAIRLLETQTKVVPQDAGSWKALMALHERRGNWPGVVAAATRLHAINPRNPQTAYTAIDAAFRSGDVDAGLRLSEPFLRPDAPPDQVDAVLTIWAERWNTPKAVTEAKRRIASGNPQHLFAYATFFNAVGRPEDAATLLGGATPRLPVTVTNMTLNALIATSMAMLGQQREAQQLFDAVLAEEPDHVYALRGRINLEITTGQAKAAITDAQRLVSVVPDSARYHLLLARAYSAAGDQRQVDRTLWNAFHKIPANVLLFEALRDHVRRSGGPEAVARVEAEFQQQQDGQLSRDFL